MAFTSFLALLQSWSRLYRLEGAHMSMRELFGLHRATGSWLALAAVSAYGATQLFPYMLAGAGAGAVAAFAAARNVLNALNVIVQAANNYLPIKTKRLLEHEGASQMSRLLRRAAVQIGAVAGVFCLAVTLVSSNLLVWIYGKPFNGAEVLPLLAVGAFAAALFPVLNAGILALQRAPVIFVSNAAATVFNLSAGWWLIARYGVNGAAIAASASLVLVLAIQSWRLHDALDETVSDQRGKPCLP
jgi:O-antigen/teichoic acid export membrane protein